jgi:hypothetical protein
VDARVLMVEPAHTGVPIRTRVVGAFSTMSRHGRPAEIANLVDLYRDVEPDQEMCSNDRDGPEVAADARGGRRSRQVIAHRPAGSNPEPRPPFARRTATAPRDRVRHRE